jgi:hypothetical protein
MANKHIFEKTLQEQYYDKEYDYIDESLISREQKLGMNDCIKYISRGFIDDEVLWYRHKANQGIYYREPYKPPVTSNK